MPLVLCLPCTNAHPHSHTHRSSLWLCIWLALSFWTPNGLNGKCSLLCSFSEPEETICCSRLWGLSEPSRVLLVQSFWNVWMKLVGLTEAKCNCGQSSAPWCVSLVLTVDGQSLSLGHWMQMQSMNSVSVSAHGCGWVCDYGMEGRSRWEGGKPGCHDSFPDVKSLSGVYLVACHRN